jgi:serine protease
MRLRRVQALLLALAGIALAAPSAHATELAYVPGQVLTKFKGQPMERTVNLPARVSVPKAVHLLRGNPAIAYANPNYVASAAALWNPYDPGSPGLGQHGWRIDQWNFLAPTSAPGGASVQGAWQNLRDAGRAGGKGVTVAVLDTGVAYKGKGSGYARDPDLPPTDHFVAPKDFVDNDTSPLDQNGHGTHVASTIVQSTNNHKGLTGIAYNVNVMPVRVLNRNEKGTAANIARGIRYAVDHGANVINLSLEFQPPIKQCSQIVGVCNAVQYANSHGVVVVAAAGNQSRPSVAFPAHAGVVIAVGASTYRSCLGSYSDYGMGLDLLAPGGGGDTSAATGNPSCSTSGPPYAIRQYSLLPQAAAGGHYDKFGIVGLHGTSMAAAHVSGAAALLLAESPGLTPAEVGDRLESCATTPGDPKYYGAGLLDAARATSADAC